MKKRLIISLIAIFILSLSSFVLAEDLTVKSSMGLDLSYFSCDGWDNDEWDPSGIMIEAKYRYFINENFALGSSIGPMMINTKKVIPMRGHLILIL